MVDRLFSALWVPVLVIIVTTFIIIGIGELLLFLAEAQPEAAGVKEPISVIVALILALVILLGATWISRNGQRRE